MAEPGPERERRLQRCRAAFREPPMRDQHRSGVRAASWSDALVTEFEWLDDMARSGHWGAIRLRDRVRESDFHARGTVALTPPMRERVAARLPRAAIALANAECVVESPDMADVCHWLEVGGRGELAGEIREAGAIAGELSAAEFETVSSVVGMWSPGMILHALGERRFDRPGQAAVAPLMKASAERGYFPAIVHMLGRAVEHARAGGSLPNWDKLVCWLETAGAKRTVAELREAQRLAGAFGALDLERIDTWLRGSYEVGGLLAVLAADRLHADGASREAADTMLARAVALGSAKAIALLWHRDWPLAADPRAFVEEWAGHRRLPDNARPDCFRLALAMDRGEHPRPASPEEVSRFYAWADRPGPHDAPLGPARCFHIAQHLDPRRTGGERDAVLARKWYERGIDMGDVQCLDAWLGACVHGQLGLEPLPSAAAARLERWNARGGNLEKSGWRLLGSARSMLARSRELLGAAPDEAEEWRRLAALMGLEEARKG